MKSLTVRLQELEADALDRLSFVYGVSKNKIINTLIAREYQQFMSGAETTPTDTELYGISLEKDFPDEYIEGLGGNIDEANAADLKRILKCYDYAIEKESDEAAQKLEAERRDIFEILRNL